MRRLEQLRKTWEYDQSYPDAEDCARIKNAIPELDRDDNAFVRYIWTEYSASRAAQGLAVNDSLIEGFREWLTD